MAEIVKKIEPYMRKVITKPGNEAFTKYNDPNKVAKWDWIAQGLGESAAKASGLYSSTESIMFYNASEAGYPFKKGATIWQTCAGLVSQVIYHSLTNLGLTLFVPSENDPPDPFNPVIIKLSF